MADRYRVGRKVGRTIYERVYAEPSDADRLIGAMDTPELAARAIVGLNLDASHIAVRVEALRALYAVYDAWHNRIGTFDPGRELVSDGVTLTGIASLIDIEDSRLMESVCDALEPHLPTIEAALAQSPQGDGDGPATPAPAPDGERAAAAALGPSDEARSGDGDHGPGKVTIEP